MMELIKKAIFIGAGMASLTAEKIEEMVSDFVKKGELSEKQGRELVEELLDKSSKTRKEWTERVEKMIQEKLQRFNIPTRKEVEELKARIEVLEKEREVKG